MKQLITLLAIFSCALSYSQNVGIGTQTPQNKLHLIDTTTPVKDPLRVEKMQPQQTGDTSILVANPDSGIVRLISPTDLKVVLGVGHFYDTTEQATNDTWFDGRTIYTRVIIYANTGGPGTLVSLPNPGGTAGAVTNSFFGVNGYIINQHHLLSFNGAFGYKTYWYVR